MIHGELLKGFVSVKRPAACPEPQTPSTFSVFCSDSRMDSSAFVPDPVNRIFVVRNIGNQCIGVMGSLGYPISHLHSVKLAMVVGHVGCGAVKAAHDLSKGLSGRDCDRLNEAVDATISELRDNRRDVIHEDAENAIHSELMPMARLFANARSILKQDDYPLLPKHTEANVSLQVAELLGIRQVRNKVEDKSLVVGGAVHDFLGKYGEPGRTYIVNINGTRDVKSHPLITETNLGMHARRFLDY